MARVRQVCIANTCRENELTRLRFPLFSSVPIILQIKSRYLSRMLLVNHYSLNHHITQRMNSL
jgi:hypothetical protein